MSNININNGLRQEIKGMSITGVVGRRTPRKSSPSPSKSRSPGKPCLRSRTTASKPSSEPATAKTSVCKPCPAGDSTRIQNGKTRRAPNTCEQPDDSKKTFDPVKPRSVSEDSGREATKEHQDLISYVQAITSGYLVDTRSKTINNISRTPTNEEFLNRHKKSLSQNSVVHAVLGPGAGSGYGKPLVTSLNKKLTIMRDLPVNVCEMKDSPMPGTRQKSPHRWRNDYKESDSCLQGKRYDSTKSRFPDKGATGKFDHSNSKAKQADRIEVVKNAVASRQSRIPSATYINKLHNRQSPTRPEKMNRNDVQGNNNLKNKPGKPLPRETKTWKPDFDLSSINTRSSRNKTPPAKKPAPATGKAEKPSGIRSRSNSSSRSPSVERKKEKQLSDPFRQIINERVKLQHNRDSPFNATPRPNTGLNMRSYKPQLEDIKSSYMLLNTKTHQDHTRNADRAKKYTAAIDKPKPIDEEYRKQLLREAKNKFQSKGFFANSKYDKIEGLNWISWK